MHLRSLRVRGFKSFAEPVELRFEPGVAVVIGPNGSGKSNVVEAIQWAMASQAPSDLRLDAAGDVLFAGSVIAAALGPVRGRARAGQRGRRRSAAAAPRSP